MAERTSALDGHCAAGHIGAAGAGVALREVPGLSLWQMAAWHDTAAAVAELAAKAAGVAAAPGHGMAVSGGGEIALLRVAPLQWWLIGGEAPELEPALGTTLDLSHSRTHLRISGAHAAALLNRHLPLDLRAAAFPEGAVASSALHHAGVTLWRSAHGYELFLPRGYALSVWEALLQSAAQFGAEIGGAEIA